MRVFQRPLLKHRTIIKNRQTRIITRRPKLALRIKPILIGNRCAHEAIHGTQRRNHVEQVPPHDVQVIFSQRQDVPPRLDILVQPAHRNLGSRLRRTRRIIRENPLEIRNHIIGQNGAHEIPQNRRIRDIHRGQPHLLLDARYARLHLVLRPRQPMEIHGFDVNGIGARTDQVII